MVNNYNSFLLGRSHLDMSQKVRNAPRPLEKGLDTLIGRLVLLCSDNLSFFLPLELNPREPSGKRQEAEEKSLLVVFYSTCLRQADGAKLDLKSDFVPLKIAVNSFISQK